MFSFSFRRGVLAAHSLRAGVMLGLLLLLPLVGQAQDTGIPVHDPVMAQHDGTYYVFATGRGIAMWRSENLEDWHRVGSVFEEVPAWAVEAVPEFDGHSLWAPDIVERGGRYYLYYSVSTFGENASAIGVAINSTLDPEDPAYEWVDHGPVVQSVPGRDLWNAIDPNLTFDEAGTPWLAFGSYWGGVKLAKMTGDLLELEQWPPEQEWQTVAARHRYWKLDERESGDRMNGAIEAPFIFKKGDYYYLFVSWGVCCRGSESTYRIVVGRSKDITGPYVDAVGRDMRYGGGTLVVAGNEDWPGVGHSAAYTLDGVDYLLFHGYEAADDGAAKLWVKELRWDARGWPSVTLD